MIDLGKHAIPVLGAYGFSLLLMCALVLFSLRRARRIRDELAKLEARRDG